MATINIGTDTATSIIIDWLANHEIEGIAPETVSDLVATLSGSIPTYADCPTTCPQCKEHMLSVDCAATIYTNGDDQRIEHGNWTVRSDDAVVCADCGWNGTVADCP